VKNVQRAEKDNEKTLKSKSVQKSHGRQKLEIPRQRYSADVLHATD
jgi:hypothetical protein